MQAHHNGSAGYVGDGPTVRELLEQRARADSGFVYCRWRERDVTIGQIDAASDVLACRLHAQGVEEGSRVAVMLPNSPAYAVLIFALIKLKALWIPVNIKLRGRSLEMLLVRSGPDICIFDRRYQDEVAGAGAPVASVCWVQGAADPLDLGLGGDTAVSTMPATPSLATDRIALNFTSGTTGVPKGIMLTDKMFRAAAIGASIASDVQDGDVFLLWEPLYHIGGSEVLVLALMRRITLVMVERFSASQFWDEARRNDVTKIHYIGGVLQFLLRQPPSPLDRQHRVTIAWGGGCTREVWRQFSARFSIEIHESYGMTETSSFAIANVGGPVGSIGKAMPYLEVRVVDADGRLVGPGEPGEIVVRGREDGIVISQYEGDAQATAASIRDGWLHTGDLARVDADGFIYFHGRLKDSVRHRGENVSAWEVETVANEHPAVKESALVGVAAELGEQELKLFVIPAEGAGIDPRELHDWLTQRLATFQVPRYLKIVEEFERTPTERVRKELLSRDHDDCIDLGEAGAPSRREDGMWPTVAGPA